MRNLIRSIHISLICIFLCPGTSLATSPDTLYSAFPETFESAVKSSYAAGSISLASGTWELDEALIGTSSADHKIGSRCVRIRNTGSLTLLTTLPYGINRISVSHAIYGTDTAAAWELWCSTNGGSSWAKIGNTIVATSYSPVTTTFTLSMVGNVQIGIRKVAGDRLNIDDIRIFMNFDASCGSCEVFSDSTATQDSSLALGNPGNATVSPTDSNNFLIYRHQYTLSYNNSKGVANWVAWHLSAAWKGTADRCNCFTQDALLPAGYFRAATSHYTSTGFDRGHICPSDDRDLNDSDNAATFKMTNIQPQAPQLNQITWAALETYCRSLITSGKELYIFSGGYGSGGSGSLGGTTYNIGPSGRIHVPGHYWKIIVVLPVGTNDLSRIDSTTRVIAVDMPNVQSVTAHPWWYYRTTTDAIESATGLDFLSNVSTTIQSSLESTVDTGPAY